MRSKSVDLAALRMAAEEKLGKPISPTTAAEMVLVSRRAWQRWENANKSVPLGVIKRFCLVAGLEAADWIAEEEEEDAHDDNY